jgi:hypothetical protein
LQHPLIAFLNQAIIPAFSHPFSLQCQILLVIFGRFAGIASDAIILTLELPGNTFLRDRLAAGM